MPLDFQTVSIPFGQGLAQEIAPALVPAGKMHTAEQAIIDKAGSIQQRPGTDALALDVYEPGGGTNVLAGGRRLIADGRETLLTSPDRLYSYQEADSNWQDLDHAYEMDIRRVIQGERNGIALASQFQADVAYASGWIVYAWIVESEDRIYARFVDYETEAHSVTYSWVCTSSSVFVRVVPVGDYVYVVWHDLADKKIVAAQWDAGDIEAGFAQRDLGADASDFGQFDACERDSYLWLVYHYDDRSSVGSRVMRFDDDLASPISALEPFLSTSHVVNRGYGIDVDDGTYGVYVAYETYDPLSAINNQVHGFVRAYADLSSVQTPSIVRDIGPAPDVDRISVVADTVAAGNNRLWVAWSQRQEDASNSARSLNGAWFYDNGSLVDGHKTFHVGLISRPWIDATRIYVVGFFSEQDSVVYHLPDDTSVTIPVYQRNAYVLEMRVGTKTEVEVEEEV